jgi:RND superfamily putative drug exporter
VLRHKRLVVIGWLVLTIVGMFAAGPASQALDQRFSVPGREGWDASEKIVRTYGNGGETLPLVPVVKLPEGKTVDSPGVRAQLLRVEAIARRAVPRSRVAGYGSTGDRTFVSKDGSTAFAYAFVPISDDPFGGSIEAQKTLKRELSGKTVAGAPVRLTGYDALAATSGDAEGPGVLVEALIGGFGALIVLAFVFGSLLAFVPIAMAICSVLVSFLLLWGLTLVTQLSPIVQFLVALIGLGVSIDYALLIVVRWREERQKGLGKEEAVVAAMATAGRAVVFSGTTVAVGLLALIALPLPFLRSMGYGGLLIPLVATAVAVTLLPVILATIGPRLDRRQESRRGARSQRFWQRWSEGVVRHRGLAVIAALAILGALLYGATNLHMGNADPDTIAKAGPAKQGLNALDDSGIGKGAIAPVETLAPASDASAVADAQAKVEGVHGAAAPSTPGWRRGGTALVVAVPHEGDETKEGRDTVQNVIAAAHDASPDALVGGTGPLNADFIDAVYGAFPLMIALISVLTFLLLARAFRSLLLPAKAIVLNVLSVGAAWGILVIVWQNGHGSEALWGISPTGSIASWIPLMVFAFLYGLSMDYEVFILSRVREEYDITHDTDEAVAFGLARTGRLVTSAALILFLAFAALASGPQTDVKILATGLAAGILLDATVVRALLVPALVSWFGEWNWWLPSGVARILRVRPSPEPVSDRA